jgi:endonuclease YncB( thermonuclease family)
LNKKLIAPIILGVAFVIISVILIFPPTQLQCSNDKGVCYETTLLRIIDGDTMKGSDNKLIRFSLVSAPELDEKGGDDSKVFLEAICPIGSKITVDEDDGQLQGSYDKIMAQVYCNGMSMNAEMIYNNHATIDVRSCGASEFTFELWAKSCGMEHDKFLD